MGKVLEKIYVYRHIIALSTLFIAFLACYAWFLPSHHSRLLVLHLTTGIEKPGLLLSDNSIIEQSITLPTQANELVIPLQIPTSSTGQLTIAIRTVPHNEIIATEEKNISEHVYGDMVFSLRHTPLKAHTPYIVSISTKNVDTQDDIRLPSAYGKYSNLSELVNVYIKQKSGELQLKDSRHGNIAMQLYETP